MTHRELQIPRSPSLAAPAERIGAKPGRASPEELAHVIEGLNEIIG